MAPFKLVLFDFDGTLVDSEDSIVYCYQKTFESFGQPAPSRRAVRGTIGIKTLAEGFDYLRGQKDKGGSPAWVQRYRDILTGEGLAKCRLYAEVPRLLEYLNGMGVLCAVVSLRKTEIVHVLLERFNLTDKFSLVVGGDPEPYLKPDPLVYERLIKPHIDGIRPDQILMVGDTEFDLEFASNIGARSCWASYGHGDADKCLARKPDYQAGSVCGIIKLFES